MAVIKGVTFDLWQTLLLDNRELGQARAAIRLEGAQDALAKFHQPWPNRRRRDSVPFPGLVSIIQKAAPAIAASAPAKTSSEWTNSIPVGVNSVVVIR